MDNNEKIGIIAIIFALIAISIPVGQNGGGGVSFNGNQVDLNGSQLNNGTFNGTFLPTSEKLLYSYEGISSNQYINFTGLSINNDSFYKIYIIINGTGGLGATTNIRLTLNQDEKQTNFTRQYVYASGTVISSAYDYSSDITAVSDGWTSQTKFLLEKSNSGHIRAILEGNFNDINFFNMQLRYNNPVHDITSIGFKSSDASTNGYKIYIFGLR